MKLKFIVPIAMFLAFLITACDNSTNNIGTQIQPNDDRIVLKADTFLLNTLTEPVDYIVSKPDSLLLGTFIDNVLGTTRADVLTQLAVPTEEFVYLDPSVAKTVPDSVVLRMSFGSYFGVTTSPIEVSVYELKKALKKKEVYYSNIDPNEYVDFSKKLNAKTELVTIKDGLTGKIQTSLAIKLSDEFMNRFFTMDADKYSTQEKFEQFFKGLYITTDFGSSTMVNINNLTMTLHYHYIYNNDPTQAKIKSYHLYPANDEIVKVNRVQHEYRNLQIDNEGEYNYIASPSNYLTKIQIPIARIKERVSVGDKNLDINNASIKIDLQDKKEWNPGSIVPEVSEVLLIREDLVDEFFANHEFPTDTTSFLASLRTKTISINQFSYSYQFDNLAKFIKYEMEKDNNDEFINMVLVPVSVKITEQQMTGQSIITNISQASTLQAGSIFGKNHKTAPIRMELVYSGY